MPVCGWKKNLSREHCSLDFLVCQLRDGNLHAQKLIKSKKKVIVRQMPRNCGLSKGTPGDIFETRFFQKEYVFRMMSNNFFSPSFKRILVLISHSQDFLNGVCTNIIHLHQRKLKYYTVSAVLVTFLFFLLSLIFGKSIECI